MVHRIEVSTIIRDTRAEVLQKKLKRAGFSVERVSLTDVYTVDAELKREELERVAAMLRNPVTQNAIVDGFQAPENFDLALEAGFLPGVTDNVANTARQGIEDLLERPLHKQEGVYTSQIVFIQGDLSVQDIAKIRDALANPVIQRTHSRLYRDFMLERGMPAIVPRVSLPETPNPTIVDVLGMSDEQLATIGQKGIPGPDGSSKGPLALRPAYMYAIRDYFKEEGRNPTDVELESIAQTWSEHCKHTIFADPVDYIQEGFFKRHIKGATEKIRKLLGEKDFCVSVFEDNSGGIDLGDGYIFVIKLETHNTPSFLDPFGGAITGIVGVNRDIIGFGLGALPIINMYGYCFADPNDMTVLYRGKNFTQKALTSRQIMDGVVEGVNVGGNCSGIPTPQGFAIFDSRYRGKPLVYVGTGGIIPKESAGRPSHKKKAQPGDYIVIVGGRVGKDGIHGATFSSEAMHAGSPSTAVQIGDPITQKKASDALISEARDRGLYNSITDNGAGGLSCSVGEMAKESGGCVVYLGAVSRKYPGLENWETWISESQERMTVAVPKGKWGEFKDLMKRRRVEATIIGEFTDSGRCVVQANGSTVMDVDMDFLHKGLPAIHQHSTFTRAVHEEPELPLLEDLTDSLHRMMGRLNIASKEFISQQYDHEVKGLSVTKPLQGRGRVNADATVTKPRLGTGKGIILAMGITPSYSDIDTYNMAACAIDTAVRSAVAAGAQLEKMALLDNFCWCSSDDPERLGQLKRAAQACYDTAVEYLTPFISGKDSMFNDFRGYDKDGSPIKISVPPTLLITAVGVVEDASQAVTLDTKLEGDFIYVLGETHDELGGSEYFAMVGEQQKGEKYMGNSVPEVNPRKNKRLYQAVAKANWGGLINSAKGVNCGGLGVALAKSAVGGGLGMEISIEALPGDVSRDDFALYSESQGRIVVTVSPENKEGFEKLMEGISFANIGKVSGDKLFVIRGKGGEEIVKTTIDRIDAFYKAPFKGY